MRWNTYNGPMLRLCRDFSSPRHEYDPVFRFTAIRSLDIVQPVLGADDVDVAHLTRTVHQVVDLALLHLRS